MATDLYLIRKNQTFAKFEKVEEVALTSSDDNTYSIAGITGDATSDILVLPSGSLPNGTRVYFSSLTGPTAGLFAERTYFVVDSTGSLFKLAGIPGGTPINFNVNISGTSTLVVVDDADDEMKVWSSEYRDLFSTQGSATSGSGNTTNIPELSAQFSFPGIGEGTSVLGFTVNPSAGLAPTSNLNFTPSLTSYSDEAAHAPLRQTLLKRTHWKFDRGASAAPRYLYASWQDGDIIADNPPDNQ